MTAPSPAVAAILSAAPGGIASTEWGVMRHLYSGPSDILAVCDTREQAAAYLATRLDWLASLNEPTREATGIACIELCTRTVIEWPDGGRYVGPWTLEEQ